jgi:ABC-type transporter Mla MlaB component
MLRGFGSFLGIKIALTEMRRRRPTEIGWQGIGKMLRITVTEGASEQRWVLQGRLTGSSVEELTTNWCINRQNRAPTESCIVDLSEITSIDKDGEQVLLMMIRDGAKFVATGVYTKHLLESLSAEIANRPYSHE